MRPVFMPQLLAYLLSYTSLSFYTEDTDIFGAVVRFTERIAGFRTRGRIAAVRPGSRDTVIRLTGFTFHIVGKTPVAGVPAEERAELTAAQYGYRFFSQIQFLFHGSFRLND